MPLTVPNAGDTAAARRVLRPARGGFSLVEIIVAVAVLVIITAAIVPSLLAGLDRDRVNAAVKSLQSVTDAMTLMRADNQDWPGRISHMARPITALDHNVCWGPTNTYAVGKVNNWAGPYMDRDVPATGLHVGIGTARDSLYRSFVSGNDGLLTIEVLGVSEEDALAVNAKVDADGDVAGQTTGTVRWSAPDGGGLVTLYYYRPIRGC